MTHRSAWLAGLLLGHATGCFRGAPAGAPPEPPSPATAAEAQTPAPFIALATDAEWEACESANKELEGGLACEGQSLEGGAPLRYRHFPAVATDGSVVAVVEERDGWGHISPGVRILGRDGETVRWLPLDGTADAVGPAIERANAALREHAWVPLSRPELGHRELAEDRSETTFSIGGYSVAYERRSDGDVYLAPYKITVTDAKGRIVASRTDTERAWGKAPACNLPDFDLVGARAKPGVLLFKTGLGIGGHNCDGVEQPPIWHVLAFGGP